jgi:hypothetical protein
VSSDEPGGGASPESATPQASVNSRLRRRRRRVRALLIGVAVIAIVVVIFELVIVPEFVISFDKTVQTIYPGSCYGPLPPPNCQPSGAEFNVGDGRYGTLYGTWNMSVPSLGVANLTISTGPYVARCGYCADVLYSARGSMGSTGSFDVSGTGPFHISVSPLTDGRFYTTFQGSVIEW